MDREVFAARLAASADAARRFAQTWISEPLPASIVFRVRLNQSYDATAPRPGEARYPEDSAREHRNALRRCDARTVVEQLWRGGRVPEWVNLAVVDETGTDTVIEIVCCGRFTDDDSRLYHIAEGSPPFHVLGPALPALHDGTPFSIHTRSECFDSADLRRLPAVAEHIWSLTLSTDEFDDEALAALPELPNVEIVEHDSCALGVEALAPFARFPLLRVLRLCLVDGDAFDAGTGGRSLAALSDLTITNLPPRPWGQRKLGASAPSVARLHLGAAGSLWLEDAFPPSLRHLSLGAAHVRGPVRLPARLDGLDIRLSHGTDEEAAVLLDGVEQVRSLSLRGTPVSDAILPVVTRLDPDHLDLVDTAVTSSALARLRADDPDLRLLPRGRPFRAEDLANVYRWPDPDGAG